MTLKLPYAPTPAVEDLEHARLIWEALRSPAIRNVRRHYDAMIVAGSHDVRVADAAVQAWTDGASSRIVVSGGSGRLSEVVLPEGEARAYRARMTARIPALGHVIRLETEARNTQQNLEFSRWILTEEEVDLKAVLLVSLPYMATRIIATARRLWPEMPVVESFVGSAGFDEYLLNLESDGVKPGLVVARLVGELDRAVQYPGRGFMTPVEVPESALAAADALVQAGYTSQLLPPADPRKPSLPAANATSADPPASNSTQPRPLRNCFRCA
ncbi:YdcF family protein [Salininema proteolyticum]|uniref:YdcF family protein n=1 Tax=Salininema proteolyticum TaxID=1607685 RepID=A0ABV8TZB4_9ACTN